MKGLISNTIELTSKVLDLRLERQNLVMSNIANVNTPDYKPKELHFEKQLQRALNLDHHGKMARTSEQHLPNTFHPQAFQGEGEEAFQPRYVYGENTVDMDKEVTSMAKNAMMYNALTQVISKKFRGLNKVIQAGKM
jgi:flagellar basal-body rod protein FlgB